jgi:hypothetical protein
MATVAMAVITGKRQNSHTMVSADRAKIAHSAAIRAFAESFMPLPPEPNAETPGYVIHPALLNGHTVKTPKDGEGLIDRVMGGYPSMVSRRQCRAVNAISTSAAASDAAADTHTSSAATVSSFSTLVISKCWLSDGMNINEAWVFSE